MSIKGTGTSTLPKTDMVPSKRSFFITALDGSNSYRTVARHKRIKQMIILTSLGMRSYQSKKSFIQREFSSNYFLPAIFWKVSECDTRVATWNKTANTALYFIWCRTLMRHQSSIMEIQIDSNLKLISRKCERCLSDISNQPPIKSRIFSRLLKPKPVTSFCFSSEQL